MEKRFLVLYKCEDKSISLCKTVHCESLLIIFIKFGIRKHRKQQNNTQSFTPKVIKVSGGSTYKTNAQRRVNERRSQKLSEVKIS